jgi:hypothetical protein
MNDHPTRLSMAIEFVRLGYGDTLDNSAFRSLYFQTDTLTTVETQSVLEVIPEYDAFDGRKVASAIGRFRKRVSGWSVGRAGSPSLLIELPYWTHQAEEVPPNTSGVRISESEHNLLVDELRSLFVDELDADVFDFTDDSQHKIQVWWD